MENNGLELYFYVDGQNLGIFTAYIQDAADLYHTRIYSAGGLAADSIHTLFLNVTSIMNDSLAYSNIHLDYMIVTQPVAAPMVQGPSFFDDTDPAFIYSGPWSTGNGTVGDMMQTLHGASSLSSSVELTFNGERVPALLSRSTPE
jgi:hypothetical protein